MNGEKALEILNILKKEYPDLPKSFLEFKNSFELLISVILSAQCTDKMVNIVTPKLFAAFPDAKSLAGGSLDEIMAIIKPTGFFQNKARSIKNCACELVERFGSKVPESVEELVTLPGVGRKTANVVTQIAFDKTEGVVIDTHVKRLSNRIGFSAHDDVDKIENDLMALFPKKVWKPLTFYLILHGRNVCDARKPDCEHCVISTLCGFYSENKRKPVNKEKTKKAAAKTTGHALKTKPAAPVKKSAAKKKAGI
ncbi:MAG TPA: endonuclease III [Candidatus Wallbacteria bacterium]|nr:MAG: Ultraviolet N-glycosylase/AP lyase [bacterium ADurb.Bin243]HPG57077.1 endonuclease III [Candidatus Wallbacteria bacterium]